ncbi:MAG TPA: M43 family zinc metalloprotease, partial [Bacteroidia bacterium]|nr:M43 family zinc metalloprotease [Bacteroidia bacterium]
VKTIGTAGVAGYAYLPGTAPSSTTDGILILSSYIGSIGSSTASHSRSLTHEIGHFLNLKHVWGNTNTPSTDCGATGTCGDDGVNDTPHTKGWGFCCNLANDDICVPGTHENVQNYMEYSYCSCMFTAGQVTRMRSALTSATAQRSSLWTASNLVATGVSNNPPTVCKPNADFVPNNITMVCAGSSVTFTDASWNGHPTSWNWSFPGGTPATSTDSIPVIQYNTPGTYNVTLTASNSSGSSTTTKNGIVIVSANTAQYNSWQYYEGFESATTFTSDWIVNNPEGNGWARSTAAAYTGTGSARLANTSSMGGQVDELISPSIDFSAIGSTTMTFRIAYAQRTSTSADKLRVLVSTNCGASWTQRYVKIGATLSTATATTSNFMPNSSQWRQETLNLSNLATQTNVRIKFEFTSDGGNNIYLDDINLTGPSAVSTPDAAIQNFDVFPNPVNDNTLISFSLQDKEKVDLSIYDMTGREVMTVYSGDLDAGDHQFPLNTSGTLSPGVYLVRMVTVSGRSVTQRMIVD